MTLANREAAARILAATLTLLAREEESLPAPFALWRRPLKAGNIKDVAVKVAEGLASVVWVDDGYPARGLLIRQDQPLESVILGYRSSRLLGPWLFEPDQAERQRKTAALAQKALALSAGPEFMALKTSHDPAIIRGFNEAGFVVAEIGAEMAGPLLIDLIPEFPFTRREGLTLKSPGPREGEKWLNQLGELFYDGHYLHGPYLPRDFAAKLWRAVSLSHLSQSQPALFLWEEFGQRPVAVALATTTGQEARLLAIHVALDRRGQGLGRLLLLELTRMLADQGVTTLVAETSSYNLPAIALYQSLGLKAQSPVITLHGYKAK
ncbi:MAG: GNAT family N-acetyltransferase [Deltaproteobacteria bacterium]|jgi:GNAT superfamily N-acetyltransferase|nr:GNAT family N-acetyltransferase [Deltaproteobacteria bacterium]